MSAILPPPSESRHLQRLANLEPRQAKASLHSQETLTWKADIGQALDRAIRMRGWTLKQFAAEADRDLSQCGKWIAGTERPQLDVIMSIPSMRMPFVIAMAQLAEGAGDAIEITTHIQIKRRA